jgi:hypothetical protein
VWKSSYHQVLLQCYEERQNEWISDEVSRPEVSAECANRL